MSNQQTKADVLLAQFLDTHNQWSSALSEYAYENLVKNPATGQWSVGQVYMHIIASTRYFFAQLKASTQTNDHAGETYTEAARQMFINNAFPDEKINGPASNDQTPQPKSVEYLTEKLNLLEKEIHEMHQLIANPSYTGKTAHPSLKYFNAAEWFQYAEMHMRHHLRQKARIDAYLNH